MVSTRYSSSLASSSKATVSTSKPKPKAKPKPNPTVVVGSSKFPYDLPYPSLDLRTHPHLYRTGIGEQGVLMVEPYKSEILPHWRFKDPPTARASSSKLLSIFNSYLDEDDFVGADMTRKFIQMGYTRARRYANHKGGKKYTVPRSKGGGGKGREIPRLEVADQDPAKVEAARIFKEVLDGKVWTNEQYKRLREEHLEWSKGVPWPEKDGRQVQEALEDDAGREREVRKW